MSAVVEVEVEEQFESMERQAHAARLGMWVFLASEVLLFAGIFALLTFYRTAYPAGFTEGAHHNAKVLGSINTGILLTSSYLAACAVHQVRAGRASRASLLLLGTLALGALFLALKLTEYGEHFREGIFPGGQGAFFAGHREAGLPLFFTLYFLATGLHALHVTVGMVVLATAVFGLRRGRITAAAPQRAEVAALYWHLVDVLWIFLWPLFYLG